MNVFSDLQKLVGKRVCVILLFFLCFLLSLIPSLHAQENAQAPCAPKPISGQKEYKDIKKLPSGCPGYDDVEPGVANFIISGVKMDIPRPYIVYDRLEADGIGTGVQLEMIYPDMRPRENLDRNPDKIHNKYKIW